MSTAKKKILTIVAAPEHSGDGARLLKLLRKFLAEGYEVHYVAARKLPLEESPNVRPHIVQLPFKKQKGFFFWIVFPVMAMLRTLAVCLSNRFRGIVVFTTSYALISSLASILTVTPLYLVLRSTPWKRPSFLEKDIISKSLVLLRDAIALQCTYRVFAASFSVANGLEPFFLFGRWRILVVPFAVAPLDESTPGTSREQRREKSSNDFRKEYKIPAKSLVVVTAGVLAEGKNIEQIIRALNASMLDDMFLIVCGDGPERIRLESIAFGLGVSEQVSFPRWSLKLEEVFPGCDLFVLPSKDLVVSNSVFEALDAGVPILTADTEPLREVVKYEELLFNPDDVYALSLKLRDIATRKASFQRIKELSFKRARELSFDWEAEVLAILDKKQAKSLAN